MIHVDGDGVVIEGCQCELITLAETLFELAFDSNAEYIEVDEKTLLHKIGCESEDGITDEDLMDNGIFIIPVTLDDIGGDKDE